MKLTEADREQMISLCTLWSGYSEEYFQKLSDEDLSFEYQRRTGGEDI